MNVPEHWRIVEGELKREYQFPSFKAAVDFSLTIANIAESQDHHPAWEVDYSTLRVRTCTHSAGHVVTQQDIRLAESIEAAWRSASSR